jgi:hypothetical protein
MVVQRSARVGKRRTLIYGLMGVWVLQVSCAQQLPRLRTTEAELNPFLWTHVSNFPTKRTHQGNYSSANDLVIFVARCFYVLGGSLGIVSCVSDILIIEAQLGRFALT